MIQFSHDAQQKGLIKQQRNPRLQTLALEVFVCAQRDWKKKFQRATTPETCQPDGLAQAFPGDADMKHPNNAASLSLGRTNPSLQAQICDSHWRSL